MHRGTKFTYSFTEAREPPVREDPKTDLVPLLASSLHCTNRKLLINRKAPVSTKISLELFTK